MCHINKASVWKKKKKLNDITGNTLVLMITIQENLMGFHSHMDFSSLNL